MNLRKVFLKLGFSENEANIYLALLIKSNASVRTIAEQTKVGRGTVYNILKDFQEKGLAQVSEKGKLKYFTATDPEKIFLQYEEKEEELKESKKYFESILPELKEMFGSEGEKPNVTYYTGRTGIKTVLQDILLTCKKSKDDVLLYSSKELRSIFYEAFPEFTEKRIKSGVKMKVIKLGEGGFLRGLDEAKYLPTDKPARTYTYIYGNKVAYVTSKSSGYIMCAIINEENIARTQRDIFNALFEYLPSLNIPRKSGDF